MEHFYLRAGNFTGNLRNLREPSKMVSEDLEILICAMSCTFNLLTPVDPFYRWFLSFAGSQNALEIFNGTQDSVRLTENDRGLR